MAAEEAGAGNSSSPSGRLRGRRFWLAYHLWYPHFAPPTFVLLLLNATKAAPQTTGFLLRYSSVDGSPRKRQRFDR